MKPPPTFARDRKLASVGGRPQINADVSWADGWLPSV
jgi:hypothetical protein